MENDTKLCVTCLSIDRRLVPIHSIMNIIHEINFTELFMSEGGICWECRCLIMKFHRFKMKVIEAQAALSQYAQPENLKSLSSLVSITKNHIDQQLTSIYDTNYDIQAKSEIKMIKQECKRMNYDDDCQYNDIETQEVEFAEKVEQELNEITDSDKQIEVEIAKKDCIDIVKDEVQIAEKVKKNSSTVNKIESAKKSEDKLKLQTANKLECVYIKSNDTKEIKRSKICEKDLENKFIKIVFSEEEMVNNRTNMRNRCNYKKIPFKCDSCVLGFTKKETYDVHIKKRHSKTNGSNTCDVCDCRFKTKTAMFIHKSRHYIRFKCRLCSYDTSDLCAAFKHGNTKHENDGVNNIHCKQCDDVYKTPKDLEDHIQSNHTVCCNECGVKFKGNHTLRRHKARMHGTPERLSCTCGRTFRTATRLEAHAAVHGAAIAKSLAYCRDCHVQYKNIYVYRSHLKNSKKHAERTYSCPECNKNFTSKVYWTKHYEFYHLHKSQFKCGDCNKLFISDWRLKNHKQKHHGFNRPRNYSCDKCGKKFFTMSMLRNHKLTHSEERSYMCEDCGDTFKQRPALYTHAKLVHVNKRNK